MSKSDLDLPQRLRGAGATALEQRLLDAAGREQPSRELSERMAAGIGIALPTALTLPTGKGSATTKAGGGAPAAHVTSSIVPWVSGALVAALIAGAFVATRPAAAPPVPARATPASKPAAVPPPSTPASPADSAETGGSVTSPERTAAPLPAPTPQRGRREAAANDLADQIALLDSARAALGAGDGERALGLVRQYQSRYPRGAFGPEAAAVKIEALVKLGRTDEARAAAERFLAARGPSPLADRVARLAGLRQP